MNSGQVTILVRGAVQGVGFRPFVYRLASELGLKGWVRNTGQGVQIELEGVEEGLQQFLKRLRVEKPAMSIIEDVECSVGPQKGYESFKIHHSSDDGDKATFVLPDMATCNLCLEEMFDAGNRRYLYPFINCTHCGPRFSIIESLPYDRANTSMKKFKMCRECEAEYSDPSNRRFHAEPNACAECGPQLQLCDMEGCPLATKHEAFLRAAESVRAGQVVAIKGLGGFQLITDARNHDAVLRLRARKHRAEKPFALMYPDLETIQKDCYVSEEEKAVLQSFQAPIVLLKRRGTVDWSVAVAPGNPWLGVMLPYTPLHHLLLRKLRHPIVATSGNMSDEPICIKDDEALERLHAIADLLLTHDRPILRHVDDSVVRIVIDDQQVLRRARGYAPLPVQVEGKFATIFAVGAHLKNSVALSKGNDVFISQHIGDLETGPAYGAFQRAVEDLPRLYEAKPGIVACDLHPDYLSTQYAAGLPKAKYAVQHHWAHVAACMAENRISEPVLGIAWDGTGLGPDGTIWGGEFLLGNQSGYERVAHLRRFRLPGSDAAVKQPSLAALGLLLEIMDLDAVETLRLPFVEAFSESKLKLIQQMLAKGLNSPTTSSAGRLFDAVAAIIGLRQHTTFEGQAAMELEFVAEEAIRESYPFHLSAGSPTILDWEPMIRVIINEVKEGASVRVIAAKFHNTLFEMIMAVARKVGQRNVALTGGCFQNRRLLEETVHRLRKEGFVPFWSKQVPPNDGGIAFGQVVAAAWQSEMKGTKRLSGVSQPVASVRTKMVTQNDKFIPTLQ